MNISDPISGQGQLEACGTRAEGRRSRWFLVGLHEEGQFVAELARVDGEVALVVLVGLQAVELELDVSEVLLADCVQLLAFEAQLHLFEQFAEVAVEKRGNAGEERVAGLEVTLKIDCRLHQFSDGVPEQVVAHEQQIAASLVLVLLILFSFLALLQSQHALLGQKLDVRPRHSFQNEHFLLPFYLRRFHPAQGLVNPLQQPLIGHAVDRPMHAEQPLQHHVHTLPVSDAQVQQQNLQSFISTLQRFSSGHA